jgi:hypothetical protein
MSSSSESACTYGAERAQFAEMSLRLVALCERDARAR